MKVRKAEAAARWKTQVRIPIIGVPKRSRREQKLTGSYAHFHPQASISFLNWSFRSFLPGTNACPQKQRREIMKYTMLSLKLTLLYTVILLEVSAAASSSAPLSTNASSSTSNATTTTTTTITQEEDESTPLWEHIPDTISPEWGPVILNSSARRGQQMPAPDDIESWQTAQTMANAFAEPQAEAMAKQFGVTYKEAEMGGVPVLDITPPTVVCKDKIAVYLHGGGYVFLSAKATVGAAALFAAKTKLRVISIDYTLAPQSKWQDTTDEVIRVYTALAEQGFTANDIVMFGDSAGGGLAASVTLKMRDLGMGMPAALILWSPWSDVTETGDTYVTLRDAEPYYTYEGVLAPASLAYADVEDHKNPYVSPVYGDFKQGFPPTLIQGGTKELFVSNFVRLYQAIDQAGKRVKLDIYEGMPHVFQVGEGVPSVDVEVGSSSLKIHASLGACCFYSTVANQQLQSQSQFHTMAILTTVD
jgi:epsilon-lactone hydrolase